MRPPQPWIVALTFIASPLVSAVPVEAQCLEWSAGFDLPGPAESVLSLTVFDGGAGDVLYAGGSFTSVEGLAASHVASWDGSTWTALGGGVDGDVLALAFFDDGSGPALYAGGSFTMAGGLPASHIAKWDGSSWSALGTGTDGDVEALAVFNDGSGPALYAGGDFTTAGGGSASYIARWDGSAWSALAAGMDADVAALTVFDDGSGAALYAGGSFMTAGGGSASHIAEWNGTTWAALGSGTDGDVFALTTFNDGSGLELCAGGGFSTAGGSGANKIATWDGTTWSNLGSGPSFGGNVLSLISFDDGSGPALYASAGFAGGPALRVEKWSGSGWSGFGPWPNAGGILGGVNALTVFDEGSGPALCAGASWSPMFPLDRPCYFARLDGLAWAPVGRADGLNGGVSALTDLDDGSGSALYAGGLFTTAGSTHAECVAKWDGATWAALGSGVDGEVLALAAFDDGSGTALYAGGGFTTAGGVSANRIAKWNGTSWSDLGGGMDGPVFALIAYNDGSGTALYAGGNFTTAGGASANRIAKWNGSTWTALGTGMDGPVYALGVYFSGLSTALYAAGGFTMAGGGSANNIAKWGGSSWSALGSGTNGGIQALAVFGDGSGLELYAGGVFHNAGGVTADWIAKWNGSTWSALGSGVPEFFYPVKAMTVFDDGSGPALCIGASAAARDDHPEIRRWNGSAWSTMAQVSATGANAMTVFDDGSDAAPDLFVGGFIHRAYDDGVKRTWGIAEWLGCVHTGTSICFGDGSGAACPCGNTGAPGHGCQNSDTTGGSRLDADGAASLASDSLKLTAFGERPTALSIFLQGDVQTAPAPYGDGLRCTGGHLKRLFAKNASDGVVSAPQMSDPTISARSAAKGDPLSPGAIRMYQVYYRDPSTSFCPSPPGNTWNVSNGVRIGWLP